MHPRTARFIAAGALLLAALICLSAPALAQGPAPDYAQDAAWLTRPARPTLPVDVFWAYPTVYQGEADIAALDDPQMRAAAEHTLYAQASVFQGQANIFAPLYRQANVSVLSLSPAQKAQHLAVGREDLGQALDYYLKHLNQGRPFILAGHSQGSNQLTDLLLTRAGDPALKNLVAAYLIGWSLTQEDLRQHPAVKICRSAQQVGCVVTYNSVAAGYQKNAPTILPGAISVNPLTWTTGSELAPASMNLGAVFFDDQGKKITRPHFTPAQNQDGGLVVKPADPALTSNLCFGPGVYHVYDYSLFYENLRQNAAQRIQAFGRQKAAGKP